MSLLFSRSVVSSSFPSLWTAARQAPLSMGFSRQEYWSGWLFPSPGGLPDPGIEPTSPALSGGFLPLSHLGSSKGHDQHADAGHYKLLSTSRA